jgi:two-component system chemotaxis response regulator CheB
MIKVLIVDDSAFMRKALRMMLESDSEIKVIATAQDGQEGLEKIKALKPDLVTLDIEMPRMDGLTALACIMKECPIPVLMVSSLTSEGAQATIDALSLGAADFIAKEHSYLSGESVRAKEELIAKVKTIASSKGRWRFRGTTAQQRTPLPATKLKMAFHRSQDIAKPAVEFGAMVLGISTGGPFALLQFLPKLPADFPLGIAIVQHMPPRFTRSMADRLNSLSKLNVKEAEEGDLLERGIVLVAPGGKHLHFTRNGKQARAHIASEPANTIFRPSADVMMTSASENINSPLLGVIMTGMGKDGLDGLKLIKKKHGYIVAQNEESCVVYGMPKAAIDAGIADAIVSLEDLPQTLLKLTM